MPVKREPPPRALHMGCGESLVARVSLAMRYLGWARAGGLDWIDDPANQDTRLARNHLRRAVLPALRDYWPSAAATAARMAARSSPREAPCSGSSAAGGSPAARPISRWARAKRQPGRRAG